MKKNSLTTAIVAGIAGVAGLAGVTHAVNLNPDGLGQVLIYPYYTVNAGNVTLISVVNTTDRAKAVKVRFLESLNSAEVLDFNLYLSAFDVWTATISGAGAGAQLATEDRSCTVPNVFAQQPIAFRPFEYEENNPDILGLIGEPGLLRVRQGHIEMIEMGVLINEGPDLFNPAAAATHSAGVPAGCGTLEAAWSPGTGRWATTDGARAVNAPTGGLFGAGAIVDVAFGRSLNYNADAIDGFFTASGLPLDPQAVATTADLHSSPGDTLPNLSNARTRTDLVLGDVAVANIFDNGRLATATYQTDGFPNAVSAVLMNRFIYNEYNISTGLAAASEWVITFPTKRLHTYQAVGAGFDSRPFSDGTDAGSPGSLRDGLPFDTNGSCEAIRFTYWDREERTTTQSVGFSPVQGTPGLALCWEANVLAFNQALSAGTATAVLGATPEGGANGVTPIIYQQGWARIEFDDVSAGFQNYLISDDANPVAIVGLPVTGFWAADYLNANVTAGVRANFGGIHKHRGDRDGYLLGANPRPAFGSPLNTAGLGSWTGS